MGNWLRKSLLSDIKLEAFDALRSNVMIADIDLTIIYMNPSATALMQKAEGDLRKDLPRFSVERLIGSNIDVFHKNPSHQRQMLAALQKPHAATIRVGSWAFDLLVTPLTCKEKRVGFVVEWSDAKERLLNRDYAAQMKAISRSQSIIEFLPDGTVLTANDNFLRALGYRLEEVKGKHHSMFVESAYSASPAYVEFWNTLRQGEYRAAQFKRIGKSGKEVWIEGSYNPILGLDGKVEKVVKFATDVTAQIALLSDLNTLIDKNFGEIDHAMTLSMQEASAAAGAADDTSTNMQVVAASAEELAASISEISRNMEKSRAATEHAFAQSSAGEESTRKLNSAAQEMNSVVSLIQNIASQINLLALNATIEAARAGEAGKGFAVVASEVKNLANQAARATDQISQEIEGIQATSAEVAQALSAIQSAIETMHEQVSVTASAVDEQKTVTRGMSASMQTASGAVLKVSSSITEILTAVDKTAQTVGRTKEAARVLVH